jgi:AcrR family transcriptional regulator
MRGTIQNDRSFCILFAMPRHSAAQVADSREAIVGAAVGQGSLLGLDGVTIGWLAGELDMSKSGVLGHFGSKEQLQLAVLERAVETFVREVWAPVERKPAGRRRLLALCDAWLGSHRRGLFPGGCFLTTASVEFDNRPGPVRDAVAVAMRRWHGLLEHEARTAIDNGELDPARDPADVAFELNALAMAANNAFQLHGDKSAFPRARRAMERVLAKD